MFCLRLQSLKSSPVRDPTRTFTIVMLRHGLSQWNEENRFTGWVDVPLNDKGKDEAKQAGKILASQGFKFDLCFTSVLTRAVNTLDLILEEID